MRTFSKTLGLLAVCFCMAAGRRAAAQTYSTGQVVYATPSGASNDWHSDCTIGTGRSNTSYQVVCDGETWWVSSEHISTQPPQTRPDPMRPGQMQVPVIKGPTSAQAPAQPRTQTRTAAPNPVTRPAQRPPAAQGEIGPGNYAGNMAALIAKDAKDAAGAVLRTGTYECRAGGQYTFVDLHINGPHNYTLTPGGSGSYSYSSGALTFTSGPYKGAYSRMVDGKTIGISSPGNTNLGTQCEFTAP